MQELCRNQNPALNASHQDYVNMNKSDTRNKSGKTHLNEQHISKTDGLLLGKPYFSGNTLLELSEGKKIDASQIKVTVKSKLERL